MEDGTITRRRLLQGTSAGIVGAAAATGTVSGADLATNATRISTQATDRGALSVSADPGGYAAAESTPSLNMPDGAQGTIEFWMKHRGTSQENAGLVMKNAGGGENGYGVSMLGTGEDRPIWFGWKWPHPTSGDFGVASSSGIPAHTWTHVACVYDGNQQVIYLNGETDATRSDWNDQTMDGNDQPLRLGSNGTGNGRFYDGLLDEVRVWNTSRTQIEVRETMNQQLSGDEDGLVAYYSFDGGSSDLARSNDLELSGTAELLAPGSLPVPPYLYSRAGDGGVELKWSPRGASASEFRLYHGTSFDGSDAQQAATFGGDTTTATVDAANDQVHYFWLAAVDGDGNEGDVSYPAIAYPSATPSGNAVRFSGDNSYVEVSDRPRFDAPEPRMTIEFWVKHGGESDEHAVLVEDNVFENQGYGVSFKGTGQEPKIWFGWKYPHPTSGDFGVASEFGIPADEWTHVACVYDGEQQAIYIDGELDATRTDWNDHTMDGNTASLMFGANNQKNERFFAGQLDQVRIWNVARTQEQIQENYQRELFGDEEGLAGYFRTCDGGVLQGSVGVGQTGTLNNVECTGSDIELENEVEGGGGSPGGSGGPGPGGNGSGGGLLGPSNSSNESRRGFFSNGENTLASSITRTQLTLLGIVLSIAGIVIELLGVRN